MVVEDDFVGKETRKGVNFYVRILEEIFGTIKVRISQKTLGLGGIINKFVKTIPNRIMITPAKYA